MEYLIEIPTTSYDDQLCLLAGKILLYFAETQQVKDAYLETCQTFMIELFYGNSERLCAPFSHT